MRDAATDCFPVTELFSRPADPRRAHCEQPADGFRGHAEGAVKVSGRAVGTGSIEGVDIFRGLDLIRMVRTFPAGGVDLGVFLHRLPARGHASDLAFEHTDPSPMRGRCHLYWIRITQGDGAQA